MKRSITRRVLLSGCGAAVLTGGLTTTARGQQTPPANPSPAAPPLQPPTAKPKDEQPKDDQNKPAATEIIRVGLSQESFSRFLLRGEMDTVGCVGAAKKYGYDGLELSSLYLDLDRRPAGTPPAQRQSAKATDTQPKIGATKAATQPSATALPPVDLPLEPLLEASAKSGVKYTRLLIAGEPPLGTTARAENSAVLARYVGWVRIARQIGVSEVALRIDAQGSYEEQKRAALDSMLQFCELALKEHESMAVLIENGSGLTANTPLLLAILDELREKGIKQVGILLNIARLRYDPAEAFVDLGKAVQGVVAEVGGFEKRNGAQLNEREIDYRKYLPMAFERTPARDVTVRYSGQLSISEGIANARELIRDILKPLPALPSENRPPPNNP